MMKRKNLFLCSFRVCLSLLVLLFATATYAQNFSVKGSVKDTNGEPIIGASIHVQGAKAGAVTDVNGNFSLKCSPKSTLVITYIGMENKVVQVGGKKVINVVMKENAKALDEVVVTALGIKREFKSLGYAMSTIKGDELTEAGKSANPFAALYGKAAGVGIQIGAAGPTGGVNIRIRGAASLESSSNTRPLFVVDGVPIHDENTSMESRGYDPLNSFDYGSGINDINPEDIESIDILKGAKAAVLYGSEGANGVVLITTKKGAETRGLGVTLFMQHSWEVPKTYIDFQNEYGTGEYIDSEQTVKQDDGTTVRRLGTSRFSFGPKFDGQPIMDFDKQMIPYEAQPNNFMDMFRTGSSNDINVAIAGASERGSMRLSFTNYQYQGIMENFRQAKNTLSFSGRMKASKFAEFEFNSNLYSVKTDNRMPNIGSIVAWGVNRDQPFSTIQRMLYDDTGYRRAMDDIESSSYVKDAMDILWHQQNNRNTDKKFHLITSVKAKLNFCQEVYLVLQGGVDYSTIDYIRKDRVTQIKPTISGGYYSRSNSNHLVQNYDAILNYDKNFMNDRLNVLAFVGGGFRSSNDQDMNVGTYGGFRFPDWYSLNNEKSWPTEGEKGKVRGMSRGNDEIYSIYGGATISWDGRYYVEITGRNDWASTLPPKNNSYFYPGISFNWNFQDQIKIPELQYGKLRIAWADTGRPASRYFANNVYSLGTIANTQAMTVGAPGSLFSGDLKPERKREYEIGCDLRFFKGNRLEVDFSYYTNNVYNQIMGIPLSSTSGYDQIKLNAGKVKNYGYELFLKGVPFQNKDWRWEASFTMANQFSKVKKLYTGIYQKVIGSGNGYQVLAKIGDPMGDLYTYDYVRDEKGRKIVGDDGYYSLDKNAGFKFNSNVNPKFIGGINTSLYYKNFRFSLGLDYSFGSSIISMSNYYLIGNGLVKSTLKYRDEAHNGLGYYIDKTSNKTVAIAHDAAVPDAAKDGKIYHDGRILPGVKADGTPNDVIISAINFYKTYIHDMGGDLQPDNISKNNYIKFREISLAYTLPKSLVQKVNLQKVTISASARNLGFLYKSIDNIDAESTLGANSYMEYSFLPTIRSYSLGISVSF
jgi:TonB-linked SusC/RagA family outer membrane protein